MSNPVDPQLEFAIPVSAQLSLDGDEFGPQTDGAPAVRQRVSDPIVQQLLEELILETRRTRALLQLVLAQGANRTITLADLDNFTTT